VTEIRKRLASSVREEEIKRLVERGVPRKKAEELVDRIFGDVEDGRPLDGLRRLLRSSKFLVGGALVILSILSTISSLSEGKKKRKEEEEETLWI